MKGSSIKADATAEYLGVGYIIGPKTAGIMFAGRRFFLARIDAFDLLLR